MRWISLILAVLALVSSFQPSETVRIISLPPNPRVGERVILHLEDVQFPTMCSWFRGNGQSKNRQILRAEFDRVIARGEAYTGREDLWRACSLIIQNVQASDSGPYTVSMLELREDHFKTAVGHLQVSS
ncbi:carcinoembryonic antigen-related cell adhesion molecule 3-like [Candoia aspera]|uniref:carcinoembryonic antigen-related cell adhesion molecule 3-like n=1 Tax=Candoia aspera TaxID=51853 RepID=UPI002FD823C1